MSLYWISWVRNVIMKTFIFRLESRTKLHRLKREMGPYNETVGKFLITRGLSLAEFKGPVLICISNTVLISFSLSPSGVLICYFCRRFLLANSVGNFSPKTCFLPEVVVQMRDGLFCGKTMEPSQCVIISSFSILNM